MPLNVECCVLRGSVVASDVVGQGRLKKATQSVAWLLVGTSATALLGCVNPNRIDDVALRPHLAESYDRAASVHIAILSTTPFDRIKNDLQPRFQMDENKAVEEVVPNTQLLVE